VRSSQAASVPNIPTRIYFAAGTVLLFTFPTLALPSLPSITAFPAILIVSSRPKPPGCLIANHISTAIQVQKAKQKAVLAAMSEPRQPSLLSTYHATIPTKKVRIDQSKIMRGDQAMASSLWLAFSLPWNLNSNIVPSMAAMTAVEAEETRKPSARRCKAVCVG
jgi:hypothetical protein